MNTMPSRADLTDRIESGLSMALETAQLPPRLSDAARHAVLGAGKRLRPLICLLGTEAVGGEPADSIHGAVSLELIHAFSLVHDDLPALDDDSVRRGRPTLHVAYGEPMAILCGDLLMSLAMEQASMSRTRPLDVVKEVVQATTAMIIGQVHDTLGCFQDGLDEHEKLHRIHENKTGALLLASARIGAICGDADLHQLERISQWGRLIGLMYQVVDDVLDETQSTDHLGKASGKDRDAGKLTFPGTIGLDESVKYISQLQEQARESLLPLGQGANGLLDLTDFLASRTR